MVVYCFTFILFFALFVFFVCCGVFFIVQFWGMGRGCGLLS